MTAHNTTRLPPQSGCAVELDKGDTLRIISPTGEQVADIAAFSALDRNEWLSSGRTIDYSSSVYVKEGTVLYSNRSTPLLVVTADTAGRHDFLLSPCSAEMFERLYGVAGHPSCFQNLAEHLGPYGIPPDRIPTTLNLFMTVTPDPETGRIEIRPPSSRPGDYVDLLALEDLIVGVTACSAEITNNGTLKPIDVEVRPAQDEDSGGREGGGREGGI